MDDIAQKLNITSVDGWFTLTGATLRENGGSGLLKKYNHCLPQLLYTVYPEYQKACRGFVTSVVHNLKLSKVEEVTKIPLEYHIFFITILYLIITTTGEFVEREKRTSAFSLYTNSPVVGMIK